jgi:hypothetical protein
MRVSSRFLGHGQRLPICLSYVQACLKKMRRVLQSELCQMTDGYKKKDSPAIQDQYPLVSLVKVIVLRGW